MRTALALGLVISTYLPAAAADLIARSAVEAVTVFPQGAEVRRVTKVKVPAGSHVVVIPDLPLQVQAASIRVEAKATGRLEIGSVDSRTLSVPRVDPEVAASARRRIEAEIEKLRDERGIVQAELQAAEAQRTFLNNMLQLPTRPAPATGAAAGEDWGKVLALVAKEMAPVNKAIIEAGIRTRDVDRRIKDAEGRLRAEAPVMESRVEVKVDVSATQPVEAEIVVRYQVASASWTPIYDARLATGSKVAAPQMTVTRRAMVQQRTGEAWTNVALALSTTRPAAGTAAPSLRPITVDFPQERPVPMAAPIARTRAAPTGGAAMETAAPMAAAAPPVAAKMEDAFAQQAEAAVGSFQAVYSVIGRQSIAATGEARRLLIDEVRLEPALSVKAVPRVDERAFLYAKLVLPKVAPWLPGQVALFRDGTFVGNGRLPQLAPGQDHELGFGTDDRVRVKAAMIEEKRAESGIISSSKSETKSYRLTIKNMHERPIGFVVEDQIPVSNNQEIKVELIARPQPTRRDVEDRRGVLAWEDRLAADEEKAIEVGWRVTWPAAKSVVYGR
jgi:uncharacterized protein (TIGR02231 family)